MSSKSQVICDLKSFRTFLIESKELERAVKKGFNVDLPLYHGTSHDITAIDSSHFGRGDDDGGPGFYMSSDPVDAGTYTGQKDGANVIKVFSAIKNPMPTNFIFSRKHLDHIISSAPDLSYSLTNFKNDDREPDFVTLRHVINQYTEMQDPDDDHNGIRMLNILHGDFYQDNAGSLLSAVHKTTKHDGVVISRAGGITHHVAWFPHQVRVAHAAFKKFTPDSGLTA